MEHTKGFLPFSVSLISRFFNFFGDDVMMQLSGDVVIVFLPYFNRRGLNKQKYKV